MTNTKFRKRALLSSVAMLLVALVALGSATFAWFAANPNAEAHGISMKTTAAAGLVIRTTTDTTWSHSASLNKNGSTFNMQPVSQDQTAPGTFRTVTAGEASSYLASSKSTDTVGTASAGSDYYSEQIYCRLSTGSDASANSSKEVKITGIVITANENATLENCVRVSIANGTTLLGTWALSTGGATGVLAADKTVGSFSPAIAQAQASFTAVPTGLTGLSASADDTSKALTVYVWLDGQDTGCFSEAVTAQDASEIIESVQVNLTLA